MGQFSNSFPKHFSYLCEYAIRCALSCSFCEYPFIFHCLHCSPSCFDPDSLLLAYLWLGLSWIDCISANKSFSSSKTSSRKPYTSSKQQERHKHSVEITINFSLKGSCGSLEGAHSIMTIFSPPSMFSTSTFRDSVHLTSVKGDASRARRRPSSIDAPCLKKCVPLPSRTAPCSAFSFLATEPQLSIARPPKGYETN